ncbi:hypothetical protein B0H14DRAFT_3590339 [Mycena olivaceomarginata]|nr:hypothetical protein B0H14DRAFT_3590339 [Mycena olivaceomarginata]
MASIDLPATYRKGPINSHRILSPASARQILPGNRRVHSIGLPSVNAIVWTPTYDRYFHDSLVNRLGLKTPEWQIDAKPMPVPPRSKMRTGLGVEARRLARLLNHRQFLRNRRLAPGMNQIGDFITRLRFQLRKLQLSWGSGQTDLKAELLALSRYKTSMVGKTISTQPEDSICQHVGHSSVSTPDKNCPNQQDITARKNHQMQVWIGSNLDGRDDLMRKKRRHISRSLLNARWLRGTLVEHKMACLVDKNQKSFQTAQNILMGRRVRWSGRVRRPAKRESVVEQAQEMEFGNDDRPRGVRNHGAYPRTSERDFIHGTIFEALALDWRQHEDD